MKINIGIADEDRKNIADGLSRLLADTFTLYLKTHNYHWNVTGPMFNMMFMEQYTEMHGAVDAIAERIRAGLSGSGQLLRLCAPVEHRRGIAQRAGDGGQPGKGP